MPQQTYEACVCSYLRCLSYAFRSYAAHWPAQHCVSQSWQIVDAAGACCSRASSDFAGCLQDYDFWDDSGARPVNPAAGDGYVHTRSVTQLEEHGAASHSKTIGLRSNHVSGHDNHSGLSVMQCMQSCRRHWSNTIPGSVMTLWRRGAVRPNQRTWAKWSKLVDRVCSLQTDDRQTLHRNVFTSCLTHLFFSVSRQVSIHLVRLDRNSQHYKLYAGLGAGTAGCRA